jgi:solute carrier family 35 protein F5
MQYFMGLDDLTNLTGAVVGFMILNGLCNSVLSDYLWARAVVLTSPTVATIGVSITIPLALVSDFLLHGAAPTALSGTGAFLVICGFTLVNITKEMEVDIRKYFGLSHEYARVSVDSKPAVLR